MGAAGDQHQLMAAPGKLQRNCLTDTRRRTGDHSHSIVRRRRNPHPTDLNRPAAVVRLNAPSPSPAPPANVADMRVIDGNVDHSAKKLDTPMWRMSEHWSAGECKI